MAEAAQFRQNARGLMTYPYHGTLNRLLFKTPLIWWRMGMGVLLGRSMLVLTTWGRKSHQPRHTMLSYTAMNDRIYVGAGWGTRCDWYRNLLADPHVTLQVWNENVSGEKREVVLPALGRRVTDEDEFWQVSKRLFETGGDSHFRPWLNSLGISYEHEDLVANRERVYQVALDPQPNEPGSKHPDKAFPPAMETDLKWVWAAMAVSYSLGWLIGRKSKQEAGWKT